MVITYTFDANGKPQLAWAHDLNGALCHLNRVTRARKLPNDASITTVAALQEHYVGEMVQAVFNTSNIYDNLDYPGIKMFTLGSKKQVSCYDVEASCHALFATVLDRCLNGYRGPDISNRLLGGGKIETIDRDGTCQVRIDNVIKSLREWKSVCKDVILSSSKITNLANAPATVWKDKMIQKLNNLTKKNTTQKDRAFGVDAVLEAEDAEGWKTQGYLPPLAKLGQQKNAEQNNGLKKTLKLTSGQQKKISGSGKEGKGMEQSSAPTSTKPEPRSQFGSALSQYPAFGSTGVEVLGNMSSSELREFDMWSDPYRTAYPVSGAARIPQDPPAYGFSDISGLPQQGLQSIDPHSRPSVPQLSQRFLPQQTSLQPTQEAHGLATAHHGPQNFGGYSQGIVPVNYSTHVNLHGPYSLNGFNNSSNPYGSFTSLAPIVHSNTLGYTPNSSSMPATYNYGLSHEMSAAAGTATDAPRSASSLKPAPKHWRTPTMDQEFQPVPSRVKRNQSGDDISPGLNHDNEE
ncbi:hypothetical protein N0V86_005079 [Didymella sp. IMI 355093]|nr:hypothetical protein N0V86_005079 [Didymella sp. IMI 355093]